MSAMKELYMILESAIEQQRLNAQYGVRDEDCVGEFMRDIAAYGYAIVPVSALKPVPTPTPKPAPVTPQVIHREFDIAELKHSYQSMLDKHLKPLLEDALDALEIGVPRIAVGRIKRALEMIKRFNA